MVRRFRSHFRAIALALTVLVSAALRLGGIGAASFWHDEVLTVRDASVPLSESIHWVRYRENCPPLYFVIINAWAKLSRTHSETGLRLPSALFGIASILVLFALTRE